MIGFLKKLVEVKLPEVFKDGKFAMERRLLETLARQIVGTLWWVGQLHFDISFDLAILSTTANQFSVSTEHAKLFLLLSNRAVRDLRSRCGVFWYRDFLGNTIRTLSILKSVLISSYLLTPDMHR